MKRRFLEIALVAAGIVFLSKAGWSIYKYHRFQDQLLSHQLSALSFVPHSAVESAATKCAVIGQLSVPRLRLSAAMVEGDDEESLSLAIGHMKGTAPIGSKGNAVVAGHRDTAFWPLRNIRKGDSILVTTDKKYVYTVEQIQVVNPDDTGALRDADSAMLTLVTCYPFRHMGPAPKRFIVVARLLRAQSQHFKMNRTNH